VDHVRGRKSVRTWWWEEDPHRRYVMMCVMCVMCVMCYDIQMITNVC